MPNIQTADDLLRLLDENEEFLTLVRNRILTKELLELPQCFAEYAAETDRKIDALSESVAALMAHAAETDRKIDALMAHAAATNKRLDSISGDIASLRGMYRRQHADFVNFFRPAYAEHAARKNDRAIAAMIARARGSRALLAERLSYEDLGAIFVEAIERDLLDGIEEDSQDSFQNSDLALRVIERGRSGNDFYLLAQASYTGGLEDFTRSRDHAKIIERVKGVDAYAVVAGVRVGRNLPGAVSFDVNAFVEKKSAEKVLWYQLREAQMDPLE